jgi:ribosome-binding protein aMBF1 (putative translation factor)
MRIETGFVRREREVLHLTAWQLASKADIPVCDLVLIESGDLNDIPPETALRLASALGIELHDLSKEETSEGEAGVFRC